MKRTLYKLTVTGQDKPYLLRLTAEEVLAVQHMLQIATRSAKGQISGVAVLWQCSAQGNPEGITFTMGKE